MAPARIPARELRQPTAKVPPISRDPEKTRTRAKPRSHQHHPSSCANAAPSSNLSVRQRTGIDHSSAAGEAMSGVLSAEVFSTSCCRTASIVARSATRRCPVEGASPPRSGRRAGGDRHHPASQAARCGERAGEPLAQPFWLAQQQAYDPSRSSSPRFYAAPRNSVRPIG